MQCYSHPAEFAIGVCKSCGKGVCRTCTIILPRGIACSEECKENITTFTEFQGRIIKNSRISKFLVPLLAIVILIFGGYETIFGVPELGFFFLAFGTVFALGGAIPFLSLRKKTR